MRLTVVSALLLACAATAAAQDQAPASDPGRSSIGVYGHWVIEVRERDGSLVKRHEFNNALASPPGHVLVRMMARRFSAGYWSVLLQGTATLPSPCGTPTQQAACAIHEPGDDNLYEGTSKFPVLALSTGDGGNPNFPTSLILSGTFTAEVTGHISRVVTANGICPNTVAPATPCATGSGFPLTNHDFVPNSPPPVGPIPVSAGQIVQVRVEISFASPTT
jgi:hypothetical protein